MKTGFTCASGFNLVATATRGGKRLIAVVLGARSSTSRAVQAAQLFEHGFATGPLGPVAPSHGTVDSLAPVAATPSDLREDVCEHSRRHRPTRNRDEGGEAGIASTEGTNNPGERRALPRSGLRGAAVLTSGLAAGIPPVDVFTGPVRNNIAPNAAAAAPAPKQKPRAAAAKPPTGKGLSPSRRRHLLRHREHPGDLHRRIHGAANIR
jgi:D-alanyl-D-alanine carboxypeptidase